MSLLNSSYVPMHHLSRSSGGNMEMLGNFWAERDGAPMAGLGCNSFLANVFHACSPSSLEHFPHFSDLPYDDNETARMACDAQASVAAFCMTDLPHNCVTPVPYGDLRPMVEGTVDTSGINMIPTVSRTLPASSYNSQHGDVQLEGCGEGSWFDPDFGQASIPESLRSNGTGFHLVSSSEPSGDATQHMQLVAGNSVSSSWRLPMVEMSGFVDLSNFLSPPGLISSRRLTEEQRASLGLEKTNGRASSTSVGDLAKPRMNVEEQLRRFPVPFVSVQQDQVALNPVAEQRSFMASYNPASSVTTSTGEQPHNSWKSASPGFEPPKPNPDHPAPVAHVNHEKPIAPVATKNQRKRKTPGASSRHQGCHKHDYAGSSLIPADHRVGSREAFPFKSSGPRKFQKLAPLGEPNSIFQQHRLMHAHLLGVEDSNQNSSLAKGPSNIIVFPAPNDLLKAGDHVARERRRRDLMNTRYQSLDSLLPKLPCRRDRFAIVDDTKLYVQEMKQKLSDLKTTRDDYQTRLEAAKVAKEGKQQGMKKADVLEPAVPTKLSALTNTGLRHSSASEHLSVEVVIHQTDEQHDVVVFVQCRSSNGAKLFSSLLRAIEELQLEISQCSTSKSLQFFFCSAVCKVQQHVARSSLSREKMIQEMVTTLRPSLKLEGSTNTQQAY